MTYNSSVSCLSRKKEVVVVVQHRHILGVTGLCQGLLADPDAGLVSRVKQTRPVV